MPPVHAGRVQPCRRPGHLLAPALYAVLVSAVLLGVGPATHTAMSTALRLTASTLPQAPSGQPAPEDGPAEDLVPVAAGRPYVWPSGIGLLVTTSTSSRRGAAPVVRVRTTVLNTSATPYDVYAVQGPTARYDGHDVQRIADSRFASPTGEHVVPPGRRLVFETTFPAGSGRLTLQFRADFRYEAVVVDGSRPS